MFNQILTDMPTTRKCENCGSLFTAIGGTQRYCSERCAEEAKEIRRKRRQAFNRAVKPVLSLQQQEYFSFSKAAILMGCSRQYVYKLVGQGKLPASRLSSRMSLIRRADIEAMLAASPYERVIPFSREGASKTATPCPDSIGEGVLKISTPSQTTFQEGVGETPTHSQTTLQKGVAKTSTPYRRHSKPYPAEPLQYYTAEEVMNTYKVRKSWLYTCAKRYKIKVCRIAGRTYFDKHDVDAHFGCDIDLSAITEWITTEEATALYGMTVGGIRSYACRHKIPAKREYGKTYYSKSHFDELRRLDLYSDENYITVEEVQRLYGLNKANIHHIAKVNGIGKVKVGVRNLLSRADVERVMAERTAKGLPVGSMGSENAVNPELSPITAITAEQAPNFAAKTYV